MKTTNHPAGPGNIERLVRLERVRKDAVRNLCKAAEEELPVGTILEATLGRSRITGEVVGHADEWSSFYAGSVNVRNLKSGKIRRVDPSYSGCEVKVIALPNSAITSGRQAL